MEGGYELVLVNDGSHDATASCCATRASRSPSLTTPGNYGEHNAVLTGYRHTRGAHVVNLDDDGRNPPAAAVGLLI